VIRTTGERPQRAFATELFNRWQLDSAERNDSLLIFVALGDRSGVEQATFMAFLRVAYRMITPRQF